MKTALVHEFVTQSGGAERVLHDFREIFPEAPVFTLVNRSPDQNIRTGFLNMLAKFIPYKWLLPLMPRAIEGFDFSGYDLVLSDASAFAKGVITKKPAVHVCYCHTPTRYIWESGDEYIAHLRLPAFVKRLARWYIEKHLRQWDYQAAQRPDFMIANSRTVQARIKKYYDRDSTVIYPPVDTEFFNGGKGIKRDYFFTASRLEPYKRIDLVIEAFNKLGWRLKIAGTGSEEKRLKSKAKNNIEFLGRVSDEELRNLYVAAKAFIFPALEDAGIMVLESLACGTPVIGLNSGGTTEFIHDGKNGILFANQTAEDIAGAVERFKTLNFDSQKIRQSALPFDKKEFQQKIKEFVHAHSN